jgi:hypothetical protein
MLYRWRQFGGIDVSEAKRLRALQREHGELKRLVGARWARVRPRQPVRRIYIMSGAMILSMMRPPAGRRLQYLTVLDEYTR